MANDNWHSEFNPSKFLSRVDIAKLIERNEAFNENSVSDAKAPCILCKISFPRGILLNDKSFLCQQCFSEVALISYPERYEALRRQFVTASHARRLAWEEFRNRFEHVAEASVLVFLGWASLLLALVHPGFLILAVVLLVVGCQKNSSNRRKVDEWLNRKQQWEQANPESAEPTLKHFHDPTVELTPRDQEILKIFNHWPGYPPFWSYLRSVVIARDFDRCQVTGCPSRLALHVHHIRPVAVGGAHSPDNLISLCDFHHALEPDKGHERIWGNIKTRYFTLVCDHERTNRASDGTHLVRAHLRRLELITVEELRELTKTYGFCCPNCGETRIKFVLNKNNNTISVECSTCQKAVEGPQQLTEETGPALAEVLGVTRNMGKWKARWDMLSERTRATWGTWSGNAASQKRKQHREKVESAKDAPNCPKCGSRMKLVTPRPKDKWKAFWGCSQYSVTRCRGTKTCGPSEK